LPVGVSEKADRINPAFGGFSLIELLVVIRSVGEDPVSCITCDGAVPYPDGIGPGMFYLPQDAVH